MSTLCDENIVNKLLVYLIFDFKIDKDEQRLAYIIDQTSES